MTKSMQLGDVPSIVNHRKRANAKRRPKNPRPGNGRIYASPPKPMWRYMTAGDDWLTIPTERAFIGRGEIGTEYDFMEITFGEIDEALGFEVASAVRALANVLKCVTPQLARVVQRVLEERERTGKVKP